MSRFIGLLATVVLVAALVGAAIGWQFPFLGGNRAANQLGSSPETTGAGTRTRVQPANQTNGQAQNTQRTAQAPSNVPIDPERPNTGTGTADTGATNPNQPVNALW